MPEKKPRRKVPIEDLPFLEAALYTAIRPWGESHAKKPESGITLIDYDRDKYPEQRIDEHITDAWLPVSSRLAADKLRFWALRRFILAKAVGGKAVGGNQLTKELVSDFRTISDDVAEMIDEGKNVVFVPAHKHYADIGIGVGGLALALGKSRYIKDNIYQSVNKLMAIEKYHGIRIARFTALTGKIVWVIPAEGAKKYNVPREAMHAVGAGAKEGLSAVLEDPEKGVLFSVALTGGAMDEAIDEEGNITGLNFRKIPDALGASLKAFDAAVPFAYDINKKNVPVWEVGEIIQAPIKDDSLSENERGKFFTDMIYGDLKSRMERLTGLTVGYESLAPQAAGMLAVGISTSLENYLK